MKMLLKNWRLIMSLLPFYPTDNRIIAFLKSMRDCLRMMKAYHREEAMREKYRKLGLKYPDSIADIMGWEDYQIL